MRTESFCVERYSWSREAKRSSASQIPRILWEAKFYYRAQKSPSVVRVVSQIKPLQADTYFLKTHFTIILIFTSRSSKWTLFPPLFPPPVLCIPLSSPRTCHMPHPSHSSILKINEIIYERHSIAMMLKNKVVRAIIHIIHIIHICV